MIGRLLLPILDAAASLAAYPAGLLLHRIRRTGVERLPRSRRALERTGVFPIRNHYYEPRFDFRGEARPAWRERSLPGMDWNTGEQLALLSAMHFADELRAWPRKGGDPGRFHLENGLFESGDAEFWYQLIRLRKPRRVFEIGSGQSTLVARDAIRRNREEDPGHDCRHVCIEPFEAPWLERTGAEIVRRKVEHLGTDFFSELEANDILFIDSTHVIRPGGDVLFAFLELLPTLKPGVIVHVHDIFAPRDYPPAWVVDEVRLWNEQYLLEAFLTHNSEWKIIAALNYLHHNHHDELRAVAPFLTPEREPGSFYMQRR